MVLKRRIYGIQCLVIAVALFVTNYSPLAAQTSILRVFVDQSKAIQIKNLKRVSVTNPRVADVVIVSPHELIVNGLQIGRTTLYLWDEKGRKEVQIVILKDRADIPSMMRKDIKKILNVDTVDIRIIQMDDKEALILRGVVENDGQIDIIEELATAYFEGKIMNLLEAKVDFVSVDEQLRSLIKHPEVSVSVIYEGKSVIRRGDIPPVASIILEGFVDDQYDKERILAICSAFVDSEDKIKDLIDVVNPVQVLIEAHILELARENSHQIGVEWGTQNATVDNGVISLGERQNNSASFLENIYDAPHGDVNILGAQVKSSHNWPWSFDNLNRIDPLYAKINFDLQKNNGKVLASPKVVARVGSEANVRVGGEIPVFSESQSGGTVVEYKPYGLEMKVAPDVDHKGNITSKIDIVWTTIDPTTAQTHGNFTYFGLKERSTSSVVTVRDGQHIIISGLVATEEGKVFSGIPLLSKIPIIGKLFSSTDFQERRSELVIVITPSLLASKKMRKRYKQFTEEDLAEQQIPSNDVSLPNLAEIGANEMKQLQVAMGQVNDTFDQILNRDNLTITAVDMDPVRILPQSELNSSAVDVAAVSSKNSEITDRVSSPAVSSSIHADSSNFVDMIRNRMRSGGSSASNSMTVAEKADIQRELRTRVEKSAFTVPAMTEEARSLFPESTNDSLERRLKSIITTVPDSETSDDSATVSDFNTKSFSELGDSSVESNRSTEKASAASETAEPVSADVDARVDSLFMKIKSKLAGTG